MPISSDIPIYTGILNWDLTGEINWAGTFNIEFIISMANSSLPFQQKQVKK